MYIIILHSLSTLAINLLLTFVLKFVYLSILFIENPMLYGCARRTKLALGSVELC